MAYFDTIGCIETDIQINVMDSICIRNCGILSIKSFEKEILFLSFEIQHPWI